MKNPGRIVPIAILLLIGALVLFLGLTPSRIDPVAFEPPPPRPLDGVLAPNELLAGAELIGRGRIVGPEALALDAQGTIHAGLDDGRIVRVFPDGRITDLARTGGRPLGMKFGPGGRLFVCDAYKGLLAVNPDGGIETLTREADGVPFAFTDDLDIDARGTIYFTDASDTFHQKEYLFDLLEGRPHGRLLRYDPKTKKTTTLLRDLYFANGVALSQTEDFLIVNETYRYQIRRFWLKGPNKGKSDIFLENVPGFPDNVTSNRRGLFYVALFTIRNPLMDRIHPRPFLTRTMAKLPRLFWPKPKPYGFVLVLDERGNMVRSFQEPTGQHLKEITSAVEWKGHLYLGSLHNDRIGKFKLP